MSAPRGQLAGWRAGVAWIVFPLVLSGGCNTGPDAGEDAGDPLVVRASVERSEIASGDRVRMTIEVDFDARFQVEELDVGDELGGLEILERGRNTLRTVRGRTGLIDWFLLRPPTAGSYVVPPIDIVAVGPDGDEARQPTNEVFVEVATRLGQDEGAEGLRGIKPPVEPPTRWPWLVAAILLVGSAWIWWWLRKRRRETPNVALAPHELAFAELEALRSTDFNDLAQLRRYYYELSAVLRRYVEGRFGLNATDLTSQEIRARLAELGLDASQESRLKRFFVATDGVKYAAQVPSEREVETVYETVLQFVEQTVPVEAEDERSDHQGFEDGVRGDRPPGREAVVDEDHGEAPASAEESDDPDARFRP